MIRFSISLSFAMLFMTGLAYTQEQTPVTADPLETSGEPQTKVDQVTESPALEQSEKLRFFSAAPGGETGLLHVMEAGSGTPGSFRLSLHGGFFVVEGDGAFLNDQGISDFSESYGTGILSLAYTPLSFLEVFVNLRNSSNLNSLTQPELLQTQGDFELGVKGFYSILPSLALGLDLGVALINGIGEATPDLSGTNIRTNLLASFDIRKLAPEVPLRIHWNGGIIIENSDAIEGGRELTYQEQFALRINRYHRLAFGLGVDAPLPYLDPVGITPFLEYTLEIPLGIGDDELSNGSLKGDTSLVNVLPMRLTPGVRITYLKDITLDIAVDIGVGFAEKKAYLDGVPSTPPYLVWIGLTYAFDPFHREEKVVEKVVEKVITKEVAAAVTTGRVKGRVLNILDQSPIGHAIVSFEGGMIPPVATDAEGRFETYDLTPGTVQLSASKEGFKSVTKETNVKTGEETQLNFDLEPEMKNGTISGTVLNEKDQPMLAQIAITGPRDFQLETGKDTGAFASEVPVGVYSVKASAEGYLAKERTFNILEKQTVVAEFKLTPQPPQRVVIIEKDKIVVKEKINFNSGKATLRADAFRILDEVIDVLVNNSNIKRIRIEGHTDSMGSDEMNLRLSQQRAEAVRNYLIEQGYPAERLEAKGFGESMPIAPNSTNRGREQNRRVEFVILDQ